MGDLRKLLFKMAENELIVEFAEDISKLRIKEICKELGVKVEKLLHLGKRKYHVLKVIDGSSAHSKIVLCVSYNEILKAEVNTRLKPNSTS